jgi:hypothetical protein
MSCQQNAGLNHNESNANNSFKNVASWEQHQQIEMEHMKELRAD